MCLIFQGLSGDPGYEGFILGTKGENGERGNLTIEILYNIYKRIFVLCVYVFLGHTPLRGPTGPFGKLGLPGLKGIKVRRY